MLISKISVLTLMAWMAISCAKERAEVANATPEARTCGKSHPSIGFVGEFSSKDHGVSGQAEIVSDCEIKVTNFNYDGGGIGVRIYGAKDRNFAKKGYSLSDELVGTRFTNDELSVFLLEGTSLDDVNSLSAWCVDYDVDFGSLDFKAP